MRRVVGWSLLLLVQSACGPVEKGFSTTACSPGAATGACVNVAGSYAETAQQGASKCGATGADAGPSTTWPAFTDFVSVAQTDVDGGPGPDLELTLPGATEPLSGTLHTDLSVTFNPVDYETMNLHSEGVVYLLGQFKAETDGGVLFDGTYYYNPGASTTTTAAENTCDVVGTTFWLSQTP